MTANEEKEWELCTRSLCVQKVPKHLSPIKLNVIFEFFASKGMTGIRHIEFTRSKRSIYLEFNTPTDAQNALQQYKDNLEWEGEKLVLSKRLYRPSQLSSSPTPGDKGGKGKKIGGDKNSSGREPKTGLLDRFPPLPAGTRIYTNDPRPAHLPPGPISRLLGATRAQTLAKAPLASSRDLPSDPWLQKDNGSFRGYAVAEEPRGFDLPQLSANYNDILKPPISNYGRTFQTNIEEDSRQQRLLNEFGNLSRDREPIRDFDISLDRNYPPPRDHNEPMAMGVERESVWETLYPVTGQSRADDFQSRYGATVGSRDPGGIGLGQQRSPPVVVRDLQSMIDQYPPRGNRLSRSRSRSVSPQRKRRYHSNVRSRSPSPDTHQRAVISKVNQSYALLIANRLDKMSEKQQAFAKMKIEEALYSSEFGIFGNSGASADSSTSVLGADQGHPQARAQSPAGAIPAARSGQQMLSYLAMQLQQRQSQLQNQERQHAYGQGQGQALDGTQR